MNEEIGEFDINMASVMDEKVMEEVRNFDVLDALQKLVASEATGEEAIAVKEKLQGVMDKYNQMSEDEKLDFQTQVKDALQAQISLNLQGNMNDQYQNFYMFRMATFVIGVLILLAIFVFFGYKLYKSIKDKEIKKEEKKKQKQMKKKK